MTVNEIVDRYYDAWENKGGDFGDVPLADDFSFKGPMASFDSAEGYRQMARQAGSLVTSWNVRQQVIDGNRAFSVIDWEMALPVAPMSAAEVLEVEDGKIVRGELFYDAEELRRAMVQAATAD